MPAGRLTEPRRRRAEAKALSLRIERLVAQYRKKISREGLGEDEIKDTADMSAEDMKMYARRLTSLLDDRPQISPIRSTLTPQQAEKERRIIQMFNDGCASGRIEAEELRPGSPMPEVRHFLQLAHFWALVSRDSEGKMMQTHSLESYMGPTPKYISRYLGIRPCRDTLITYKTQIEYYIHTTLKEELRLSGKKKKKRNSGLHDLKALLLAANSAAHLHKTSPRQHLAEILYLNMYPDIVARGGEVLARTLTSREMLRHIDLILRVRPDGCLIVLVTLRFNKGWQSALSQRTGRVKIMQVPFLQGIPLHLNTGALLVTSVILDGVISLESLTTALRSARAMATSIDLPKSNDLHKVGLPIFRKTNAHGRITNQPWTFSYGARKRKAIYKLAGFKGAHPYDFRYGVANLLDRMARPQHRLHAMNHRRESTFFQSYQSRTPHFRLQLSVRGILSTPVHDTGFNDHSSISVPLHPTESRDLALPVHNGRTIPELLNSIPADGPEAMIEALQMLCEVYASERFVYME